MRLSILAALTALTFFVVGWPVAGFSWLAAATSCEVLTWWNDDDESEQTTDAV